MKSCKKGKIFETKKRRKMEFSSSEEDVEVILGNDENENGDFDGNLCVGCGEDYRQTKKKFTGLNAFIASCGYMKLARLTAIPVKNVDNSTKRMK
ncbi:hypothetical protein JTB14_000909 [Gonioctena quinquepunctata]|nr:hypothetical protein JTB14_000909 [Gonioctena quinquepunctata]